MSRRTAQLGDWLKLLRYWNYPNYLSVVVAALAVRDGVVPVEALAKQFLLFGVCLYSGIYIVNEVLESDLDRRHPVKRERPVASGRISRAQALGVAAVLWTIAFGFSEAIYRPLYLAFIAVNLIYALYLKHRGLRNLIAATASLRVSLGFMIAGKSPLEDVGLIALCTLLMASVQQVKFAVEGTRGDRHTGPKLLVFSLLMALLAIRSGPEYPITVAATALATGLWVFIPWRFPRTARWLIGADVTDRRKAGTVTLPDMVVFDVDGTLCDSMNAIRHAVNEMAPVIGFDPVTEARYPEFRAMTVTQIQKTLGLSAWQLSRIGRHVRHSLAMDKLKPIAGIPDELDRLHRTGYRLAIVSSNQFRNVEAFLRTHGMDKFDEILTHQGWGTGLWRKQRQLGELMTLCRYDAGRFVYVCDEIRDVEAAHAVGMPVVAVTWGANSSEALAKARPTATIDTPSELLRAVRTALEGRITAAAPSSAGMERA